MAWEMPLREELCLSIKDSVFMIKAINISKKDFPDNTRSKGNFLDAIQRPVQSIISHNSTLARGRSLEETEV